MCPDTNKGRRFEEAIAAYLGADLVPGSGSGWAAKLDLGDEGRYLFSLKRTDAGSFPLSPRLLHEIDVALEGPGGVGLGTIGGLIVGVQGDSGESAILCMWLGDAKRMLEEKRSLGVQSKADARVERASTPAALRDDADVRR